MNRRLLADFSPIYFTLGFMLSLLALSLAVPAALRAQAAPAELALPLDREIFAPGPGSFPYPRPVAPLPVSPTPRPPWRNPVSPGPSHLTQMVQAAGMIFSGQVTHVGRAGPASGKVSATTITFQVQHAMRGTMGETTGGSVTIREWSGLWARGERYRVGERVLLFLYPPSKLGLTSPVSGAVGRFAVGRQDRVLLNAEHADAFAAHPVLGGRKSVAYSEFAEAVRTAGSGEQAK
jgi:hypothetical protein